MLWVEVLNRGLDSDRQGLVHETEFAAAEAAATQLERDLELLRAAAASLTMGTLPAEPLLAATRQWLAAVTLHVAAGERWSGFHLPALRAQRAASALPARTEMLLSTALVQLFGLGEAVKAVSRCHGLARPGTPPGPWGAENDAASARAAGLAEFVRAGWQQCPRLVLAPRQARYCSKACSNAAFAARKGVRDPDYFAAKQALYRNRQRRRASARVEVASPLFVD